MAILLWALLLAGIVLPQALLGREMRRHHAVPGSGPAALLLFASTVWVLAYAAELSTTSLPAKVWLSKIEYLGAIGAPFAWLVFSVRYSGHRHQLPLWSRVVITGLPILWATLVWTDELHGWMWGAATLSATGALQHTRGPLYWLYAACAYLYLLVGSLLLLSTLRRTPREYHAQGWGLAVCVALPWVSNVVYLTRSFPVRDFDPTPFALAISTLILGWSVLRLRLLRFHIGLIPLARDAVVAGMADGVLVVDGAGKLLDLNPAATTALSGSGRPALGDSLERVFGMPVAHFDPQRTTRVELASPDGRPPRYFDLRVSALGSNGNGRQQASQLIVLRDVTDRHYAELALRESEHRYRTVVDTVSEVIFQTDRAGRWRLLNPAWTEITGYTVAESLGTWVTAAMDPADHGLHHAEFAALIDGSQPVARYVVRYHTQDGLLRWLQVHARPAFAEGDVITGVTGTLTDITDRKLLEQQLTYQAFHDPLTGLANRALFAERVGHALARAARHPASHAVMFLDLDHFKNVNDSLGHGEGDRLLGIIGDRLRHEVRESDTVARLGGDEFAVLIEDLSDPREAKEAAERLLATVRAPIRLLEAEVFVTLSLGIAVAAPTGDSNPSPVVSAGDERREAGVDALLQRADIALYQAKRAGRNQAAVFVEAMAAPLRQRLHLEAELHRAIERDELVVHYQPMIELHSRRIRAVEALVRWRHPTRGLVPPGDFIVLAEETGLILDLGRWVLEHACRQVHQWHRQHPAESALIVSVNLSARQFQAPGLVADVAEVLADTGLDPRSLLLEITESAVMHDTEATLATLRALKSLGVRLAIDDFGTGYSSLSYLQRFPIDVLKIDRAFINGIERGGEDGAFANTMIQLARALNLETVAEGIELPEQANSLRDLGCTLGQGYLFARPLDADAVTNWLADAGEPAAASA